MSPTVIETDFVSAGADMSVLVPAVFEMRDARLRDGVDSENSGRISAAAGAGVGKGCGSTRLPDCEWTAEAAANIIRDTVGIRAIENEKPPKQ